MAKFSDAVRATMTSYFNIGDQPTEAQFTALITAIQEGIEEHDHDGTGGGDGIATLAGVLTLDLANGRIGVRVGAPAYIVDILSEIVGDDYIHLKNNSGIATDQMGLFLEADDNDPVVMYRVSGPQYWIAGVDASDGSKYKIASATILGTAADIVTIEPTTGYTTIEGNHPADYIAMFFNDGGDGRNGIIVQCGEDANPDEIYVRCRDGNGDGVGHLVGTGAGGLELWSASDERLKDVLGDLSAKDAMKALKAVTPKRYKGKRGGKKVRVGFVAQELLPATEGVVSYDEESDLHGLSYGRLTPYLWRQNQALLERIEALEAK